MDLVTPILAFISCNVSLVLHHGTIWCFQTLANSRTEVCMALGIPEQKCELSMGMSSDFEQAVRFTLLHTCQ